MADFMGDVKMQAYKLVKGAQELSVEASMQSIFTALILGLILILALTGRLKAFIYGVLWWTVTIAHSILLVFFTSLNIVWVLYALFITYITKELKYDAEDFVYFSGPTTLACIALPSVLYLQVIRWQEKKDFWVWFSMVFAWIVVFFATWIGYSLVVFSLGSPDGPYDLRNMIKYLRSAGILKGK